jgi:vitamin B12 transporter
MVHPGLEQRHVAIFIDGVSLSNLGASNVELGVVRSRTSKIEIVKGPASSAWGSALGGVVNIITKSGSKSNGQGSGSIGTRSVLSASYRTKARTISGLRHGKQDSLNIIFLQGDCNRTA